MREAVTRCKSENELSMMNQEEHVKLLLARDLEKLGWEVDIDHAGQMQASAPAHYSKAAVAAAMSHTRSELISENESWIKSHIKSAQRNLAHGQAVLSSAIRPRVIVCENQADHELFRILRYSWSSPYSDYVGRRIRLIIRDDGVDGSPVIGIAALGSSIIHIPERDKWIGWNKVTRTRRIVSVMDAYVLGAVPPYNDLLGGKLIAYILASNEIRAIFHQKYAGRRTLIADRDASDLALIVTTSLYGHHSSQYNRIRYRDGLLYQPIGETSGFGSLHISNETFRAMKSLVIAHDFTLSNRFGDGPNWRMRVIRVACDILGINSEMILKHSFKRGLFAVPLASNWREYLKEEHDKPQYLDMPLDGLVNYWRMRWFSMRLKQQEIIDRVSSFTPSKFEITQTTAM